MIPNSPNWSDKTLSQDYIKYDEIKPLPLDDDDIIQVIEIGPDNLYDSQGRLDKRYWLLYENPDTEGEILISRGNNGLWETPIILFRDAQKINELSLTFDQLGNPVVFYRFYADFLKLYWYNPITSAYEIKNLATGNNLLSGFDSRQDAGVTYSDAMLFYVRDYKIYMRVQRDRYEIEYETPTVGKIVDLRSCGMTVNNRFQVLYRYDKIEEI